MTDRDPFSPLDEQNEQEELTNSGHEQPDASGDDEIIMPVPEYAERLRKRWNGTGGANQATCGGIATLTVGGLSQSCASTMLMAKQYLPFCWVRSATGEGWNARSAPEPRPLFNLNRLAARPDAPVLVVEGEKCVRAAEKAFPDYVVVTSSGGAHAAAKTDLAALAGRPEAMIWPDADEAGSDYANDVGLILHGLGMSNIRVVDANTLASRTPDGTTREPPLGWDVADAIEEGWQSEALRKAVDEAAKPWMPCSSTDPTGTNGTNGTGYGEDISSREADTNAWEHPDLSYLGTGRSAPPPFPMEVLGEFWGLWCSKHAVARNAPVDYVAGALLAVTGALIGNKRWPYAGGEWGEPPILWVGLVGAPGSGKSPAQDPVLDAVRQLERDAAHEMAAEVASYKEKLVVAKAAHEKWEQDVKKAFKND